MSAIATSSEPAAPACMFSISTRDDRAGRVVVMGKATRKQAKVFLNIPLCQATRKHLEERLVGSLSMGTGALIEWALEELRRQGITLEAQAKS
ncbi:MAG: hypothetical protein WAN46_05205 [Gammaproteobacteria bacterium]